MFDEEKVSVNEEGTREEKVDEEGEPGRDVQRSDTSHQFPLLLPPIR